MTYIGNQPAGIVRAKTIYRIINKTLVVQNEIEHVSRPVQISLRNNNKKIKGRLVFDNSNDTAELMQRLRSLVKVRYDDPSKPEELVSLFDIDMIEYL